MNATAAGGDDGCGGVAAIFSVFSGVVVIGGLETGEVVCSGFVEENLTDGARTKRKLRVREP